MCWFLKDDLKEWMQDQLNEHMVLDMREESTEYIMDEIKGEMLEKIEGMKEKIKEEIKMEMTVKIKAKFEHRSNMEQD